MSLRLSPTTFATGIKDKLAAVDIYTQKSAKNPIDAITLDVNLDPNAIAGLMGGNFQLPVNLIASYSKSKGISINANALLTGIIGSNPILASAMGSLNSITSQAISAVTGNASINATIGSISTIINTSDLSNLTGISSLISGISGSTFPIAFTDLSGLANLSTNLLQQASALGIPNAFTQIAKGLISSPNLLQAVTKAILPSVMHNSDVNMLMNIAQSVSANIVRASNPGFISGFASNFTLDPNIPQDQLPLIGKQLCSSFNAIDPNWNSITTSAGQILTNSNVTMSGSDDFNTVMTSVNTMTNISAYSNTLTTGNISADDTTAAIAAAEVDNTITTTSLMEIVVQPDGTKPNLRVVHMYHASGAEDTYVVYADGTSTLTTSTWGPTPSTITPVTNVNTTSTNPEVDSPIPDEPLVSTAVSRPTVGGTNIAAGTYPPNSITTNATGASGTNYDNTLLPDGSAVTKITPPATPKYAVRVDYYTKAEFALIDLTTVPPGGSIETNFQVGFYQRVYKITYATGIIISYYVNTDDDGGKSETQTPLVTDITTSTTVQTNPVTNSDKLNALITASGPGDPLASTNKAIANDPLVIGSVVNTFTAASSAEGADTGTKSLMAADASDALASSFPDTDLSGLSSFDQ